MTSTTGEQRRPLPAETLHGDDLCTPPGFVALLHELAAIHGGLALDPCANRWSQVGAREEWRLPDHDGLVESWGGRIGLVYANPPYSALPVWAAKACQEAVRGISVAFLGPVWSDRAWYQTLTYFCDVTVQFRRRIRFVGGAHHPMITNQLWLLTPANYPTEACVEDFARVFGREGQLLRPMRWGQGAAP